MAQEQESGAFIPDPYHVPGYTGFCPQLHYQLGNTYGTTTNCLLAKPSITKSPHSILSPPRLRPNDTPEPPKLQPSQVHSCTADRGIVLPKINIPPGYVGRRPKVQFQQASSFTRTVSDTADDFLEVQSSVTRGHVKLPAENTCGHGNAKDVYNAREWKPKAENKAPLSNCKKALKVTLPENLQRKAIPGYTGFIPLYQYALGVGFGPGVKMSMDEFDKYQIQLRPPVTSSELRMMKPPFRPATKIYSPAGLLPNYTGFVPGFRDTFGSTYGNSTRQLYIKYPL